ncbi:MAG: J domain-containing protein [Synergistaceae bacterium]|nr:J domain-containing protein [Synergistaceae bacterium]
MNSNANFKVLGLSSDASWDEVKRAFRHLARKYHPDVAGPEGTRKFSEITEAYMTLKETVAGGYPGKRAARERAERDWRQPRQATPEEKGESIFKSFWDKLFGGAKTGRHESEASDHDIPPARLRFIGSAISRAESDMRTLLSRCGEVHAKSRAEAILRRLRSGHPGVVMLALRGISGREATNDIRRAVIDHFARHAPSAEILESLLSLFSASDMSADLARVLASHAAHFSASESMMALRWLRRQNAPKECFAPFLSHPLATVVSATLNGWPQDQSLPESVDMLGLLKRDEESILTPLLRLLRREKVPMWLLPSINKIMTEHRSPVVRVWASAIVRDRKLS